MKRYYNAIISALEDNASQFDNCQTESPRTFDIHLSQEMSPDQFEFLCPALFYDYSVDFSAGVVYIYIYVVQELDPDSESYAADHDAGQRFFDFLSAVKRCLNGVKPQGNAYGKIMLYQEQPQPNDLFYCHQLTFRADYKSELDTDLSPLIPSQAISLTLQRGRLREHSPKR